MTRHAAAKLLAIVQERRQIQLEELLSSLPELTWNQVFSLVDELSRRDVIHVQRRGFDYELRVASLPP
ncbi:hypothetical protein [Candidatus Nitrospira nitrificans]|uniref:DprA winged helix domain-containing protein n=1 Tax=Candidatus Nitrospira nitrificans TaxID=1742973 RepID=A0A0S4L3Y1_9BACT|nr:hypothetical protein [Candidatus Nitrospira nitrificans]CUS31386.1 hypothetical protein COMA2_10074 [Candidatus Nitrospira nitrificans]